MAPQSFEVGKIISGPALMGDPAGFLPANDAPPVQTPSPTAPAPRGLG